MPVLFGWKLDVDSWVHDLFFKNIPAVLVSAVFVPFGQEYDEEGSPVFVAAVLFDLFACVIWLV